MGDTLIDIQNLSLQIENVQILNSISICLKKNERLGITGPSGCGKSTLMKTILGGQFPAGTVVSDRFLYKDCLTSYIPQSEGLLPWFSLQKNFKVFGKNNSFVDEIILEFELKNLMNSFPHQLSGGEYQRALVASAIINMPQVFLADEPLTALDINNKFKLLQFWTKKILEFNASLILISHDMETLIYLCDRILVLSDKPSTIVKEIILNDAHPRKIEFMVSESFTNIKAGLLSI